MERSLSIYGSSTVLRGVQLEIGKDFRPPNKVTLPVGWKTRDLSEILSLTYDFTLEEDVIQKADAEKLAKEQHKLAQSEREKAKRKPVPTPRVQACMTNDILQPTTVTSTNAAKKESKKTFNYRDFEDDTDTPFELVELQSINSMDALKSILQPELNSKVSSSATPPNNTRSTAANNSMDVPNMNQRPDNHGYTEYNIQNSGGNPSMAGAASVVADSASYPNHPQQMYGQPNSRVRTTLVNHGNVNTITQQENTHPSTPSRGAGLPGAVKIFPGPPPLKQLPPPPRRHKSMSDMDPAPGANFEEKNAGKQRPPVPKPRSKLPPIKKEPSIEQFPPALPPKKSKTKNQIYDVPKAENYLRHHPSPLPPISPPATACNTPDPFISMSPEEITLVNELSAMGFPHQRVTRAVKSFGCNEREVVEFLILVGEVCAQGYSENQAELVLKECNSNKEKAVKFLGLMAQFKELGFQEEKIFNALKDSECDSDKTLDILTCVH